MNNETRWVVFIIKISETSCGEALLALRTARLVLACPLSGVSFKGLIELRNEASEGQI